MQCRDLWYRRWKNRRLAGNHFECEELLDAFSILTELSWNLQIWTKCNSLVTYVFSESNPGFYGYLIDTPLAHKQIVFAF